MSSQLARRSLAVSAVCCAGTLTLTFSTSQLQSLANSAPRAEKATTQTLGGPIRYQTFVSTDKPIYRAGEQVYVRGVVLNAANHKPLSGSASATIEIKGPKGDTVASGNTYAQDSVWSFGWVVPDGQAGGEYTIRITYPWEGHAPAERKFDIRAYRAPRLNSQITFLRDGYGPGDKVRATLDVKRAEGGVPEGAKVTVTARVDGKEIVAAPARVDAMGLCSVSFDLPHEIPRGEGTLALVIEDGGVVETASKTIPILLQTVDLQIFPESGDLLDGYSNRVYIQARQPNGKPADLVGKLMSKDGTGATTVFHTEHEGRGRFEFTPSASKEYYLSISKPAGIKTIFKLPLAKVHGACVRAQSDVFKKNQAVAVKVGCTEKVFRVSLSKREVEVASQRVDLSNRTDFKPGELHAVSFAVPEGVDGVLTVTVWDAKGAPLAERLVYREPANPLKISIKPEKKSYSPGETAKLTIKATDSTGKPVSALVGVTVTDESVLEMVEKREQAPRLPVMVLLEPEVKDLADAQVYLDPNNPKAPLATDLLLSTQGWRRFALMDLPKFLAAHGDEARRAVALNFRLQQEVQKAAKMALVSRGPVPRMAMAVPGAPMAAPSPVLRKAQFFNARRQMQILDERPVVRDFREAPPEMQAAIAMQPLPAAVGVAHGGMLGKRVDIAKDDAHKNQGANKLEMAMDKARRGRAAMGIAADEEFADNFSNVVYVREYAHQVRPHRKSSDRVDFAETLFWNAGVKTNGAGEATVSFGLNDSVTSFRVFADGFAGNGALGASTIAVNSLQPFYTEAKLPLEVTSGDRILLPVSLVNGTAGSLAGLDVNVKLKGDFKLPALQKGSSEIAQGARVRWIQPINVGVGNGSTDFILTSKAGSFEDKVTRKLWVKPKGFPIEAAFGGVIQPGKSITHVITIPKGLAAESLESSTAIYPTPLANLTEALERLIQDPYGCFEQTSSTSYPLTMAQQYFMSHSGVDPKLVTASRVKLDDGYKRLVGFWCPDRGYEWFGENPGHEALTAFGLLHFTDMAQVRPVDQTMVKTTRSWLLNQKDGKGGFNRKRRSLHSWIEDKDCSNAYVLWALLESGQSASELKDEIASIKAAAATSQNNYVVALAANSLYLAGDKSGAKQLMDRLATKQKSSGGIASTASVVGSGGEALEVEGTALATLAWLRDQAYTANVEKGIKFLSDSCKGGRYGSTQSTVLALRAIVAYDKLRSRPKVPGKVRIYVDGQSIGDWTAFNKSTQGAIKLPDMSELLTPGEHKLTITMEGGSEMPYSMAVKYNALTPASSKECKVDVDVRMAQDRVMEGASTEANVTVTNKMREPVPTPIAIVGLPGGLEPRHDQLKELVKKGTIHAYEVLGREVVLYWRALPGQAKVTVPLSLIAAVPGTYTGPASRAYLYYTDEHKQWRDGMHVEITAK